MYIKMYNYTYYCLYLLSIELKEYIMSILYHYIVGFNLNDIDNTHRYIN